MALLKLNGTALEELQRTTFADASVGERTVIQRALRERLELLGEPLFLLCEEFGEWEDSRRRVDLLCLDKEAGLVVVELKRTETGGHMELQAIRYAAMLSGMTFEDAVRAREVHNERTANEADAEQEILDFLEWSEPLEEQFAPSIRIILVSADFSKELTTTVLWLVEQGLDISCMRMRPYLDGDAILLDAQPIIPLPEASEYQIKLRRKQAERREASRQARDTTRFRVTVNGRTFQKQSKRALAYHAVAAALRAGATPADLTGLMPGSTNRWIELEGELGSEAFEDAARELAGPQGGRKDPRRFFTAENELFHIDGRTYALTKMWGRKTLQAVDAILKAYPCQMSYEPEE